MKNTLKFDFKQGEFVMENGDAVTVSGLDALRMWTEKCLRTQFGRYRLYKDNPYGANIEDLVIGRAYGSGFTAAELKREIETALLRNEDITAVTGIELSRERDTLSVDISLETVYGEESYTYDA